MTSIYACFIGVVLCAVAAMTASAQVTIGPTILYMRHNQSSETLTLVNPSTEDKEVSIETRFGNPTADTMGNVNMVYVDATGDRTHDASSFVSFFPKRFFLKGGTTQNVRFRARPISGIKAGLYWTRVIVTSSLAQDAPERHTGVDAQLHFECAQNIPLFVVHESAEVNLRPRTIVVFRDSAEQSHVLVETGPDGSTPFIGSLGIVISQHGRVIVNHTIPVSLYTKDRIQLLPKNVQLTNGSYEATLYWTMGRTNVLPQYAEHFQPITEQFKFGLEASGNLTTR